MKDYFPLKNNKTYGRYRKLVYFMKFEQFLESPISNIVFYISWKNHLNRYQYMSKHFVENVRFPVFRAWMNIFSFENLKSSSRVRESYEILTVLWISKHQNRNILFVKKRIWILFSPWASSFLKMAFLNSWAHNDHFSSKSL